MILTFENFKNFISNVSEERHSEVLDAAKKVISDPDKATVHGINFLIFFAQTYGTTCEDWMDLDDTIKLATLYASEEYDFTTLSVTADHGPVPYFDQKEYKEIEIKQNTLEKEGWILFKKYEDAKTQDDGTFEYKERFFDLIFYRPKYLASKKINKANQKTGIFEKYNRDDVKFKDLHDEMRIEFAKAFNLKVVEKLKEIGFNVEVIANEGDSACEMLVNTIPMHIVNRNELCFNNEKIYSNEFKNQNIFEILKKNNVDPVIGGPKFATASAVKLFFDKMDLNLYINPKFKKAVDYGVFDKE